MAQALARYFYGAGENTSFSGRADGTTAKRMIRLDMSEYAGPDAVERRATGSWWSRDLTYTSPAISLGQ